MVRRLVPVAVLVALGTACPQVERKVYRFDVKAMTGTLRFVNIVTDSPEDADDDFLHILDNVVEGTEIEEAHPGWRVTEKTLQAEGGKLNGHIAFSFDDLDDAGIFKHDKKSPFVWCTSREDDETIVSTNGTRIDALPGCVAWDKKAKVLEVTVKSATLLGGEQSLLPVYERWEAGETIERSEGGDNPFGAMGQGGEAFAAGLASGMADAMAGDATLTIGPVPANADGWGAMAESGVKICLATSVQEGAEDFTETLVFQIDPEGKAKVSVFDATAASETRTQCYGEMVEDLTFTAKGEAWSFRVPVGLAR